MRGGSFLGEVSPDPKERETVELIQSGRERERALRGSSRKHCLQLSLGNEAVGNGLLDRVREQEK